MTRKFIRLASFSFFLIASQVVEASPRKPKTLVITNSAMIAFFQAISSQNLCVKYVYDRNGNLTLKSTATAGGTGVWGTATYGCFRWTLP